MVFGYGNKIENDLRSRAQHKSMKGTPDSPQVCMQAILVNI